MMRAEENMRACNLWTILLGASLSAPAFAADPACGPHQHVVVEKDEDEGSTVKRCACDAGWDADGPGAPCRKADAAPAKDKRKKK